MNKTLLTMLAMMIAVAPGNLFGQTDFFWSLNGLNQGAVNADLSVEIPAGTTSIAYLYYTTNGPANSDIGTGAFLDMVTSQTDVIQFNSAETLDFDITLFSQPVGQRWADSAGATGTVTDDAIDELSAFTIFSGSGILESQNGASGILDTGYDAAADAYLFAQVEFTVLPALAPVGTMVDIITSVGTGGVANSGASVPVTFGNFQVTVGEEPLVLGDFTGDGIVNMMDVQPFIQAIISDDFDLIGDINLDMRVDLLDIRPFVDLLNQ